jgi:hypothetical protein
LTGLDYNPALRLEAQTFTVHGTVRLTGIVNPNDVPLNVSVQVTVTECDNCYSYDEMVWQPDFTGRTVTGNNVGGDLGILLSNPDESTADFVGNALHLTALSSRNRAIIIYTSGTAAGWNPATSFAPINGVRYTATFTASVASGTGGARIQTRADGLDARISTDTDLTRTPQQVTYSWTQNAGEHWRIDTRNTPIGVALIISDLKVIRTHTLCDGRCSGTIPPPPPKDWSVELRDVIDELTAIEITNISEQPLSLAGLFIQYEHDDVTHRWRLPAMIVRKGDSVQFARWPSDVEALKWTVTGFKPLGHHQQIRLVNHSGVVVS